MEADIATQAAAAHVLLLIAPSAAIVLPFSAAGSTAVGILHFQKTRSSTKTYWALPQ